MFKGAVDALIEHAAMRIPDTEPTVVPFPELVHVHFLWRQALERDDPRAPEAESQYRRRRAWFEQEHGSIVGEYWCWDVPSAVALTAKPAPSLLAPFKQPKLAFHRVTDWATKDEPTIAAEVHRCDELAVRGMQVLTGLRQRICLQLVMSSASHLLSLVDRRGGKPAAISNEAVEKERTNLTAAEEYYRGAANGQAQMWYFVGMAIFAVAILTVLVLGLAGALPSLHAIDDREFYGSLGAGAVGALVSVIQRINSGSFELEYDVGRPYIVFLGALRPAIGAVFGLALYLAITSDTLNLFELPQAGTTRRFFALLVIAFVAGFSERWAQDTLSSVTSVTAKTTTTTTPAAPTEGQTTTTKHVTQSR